MPTPARTSITQSTAEFVSDLLTTRLPDQYVYHTLGRTTEVVRACEEIGQAAALAPEDLQTVVLAAWFLHTGHVDSDVTQSTNIATEFLRSKRYPAEGIDKVVRCIQAVVPVHNPTSLLDEVLCDADNIYLAKKRYFEKSNLLRTELENIAGRPLDDMEWLESRVQALNTQPFRTAYARQEYGRRRSENHLKAQNELRDALKRQESLEAIAAKKELLKVKLESAQKPARGVDTLFRLVNKTNMTLNVMADRKANMMIQTNSIILSITISVLVRNFSEVPQFVIPTIILLVSCLATIIIATLATRPRLRKSQNVERRRADLLFFGNIFGMDFREYEEGMNEVISKGDVLYDSLIRDAYNVGQILGWKYRYIRYCYDIFMYGLVLSVVSFLIAYLWHR